MLPKAKLGGAGCLLAPCSPTPFFAAAPDGGRVVDFGAARHPCRGLPAAPCRAPHFLRPHRQLSAARAPPAAMLAPRHRCSADHHCGAEPSVVTVGDEIAAR